MVCDRAIGCFGTLDINFLPTLHRSRFWIDASYHYGCEFQRSYSVNPCIEPVRSDINFHAPAASLSGMLCHDFRMYLLHLYYLLSLESHDSQL